MKLGQLLLLALLLLLPVSAANAILGITDFTAQRTTEWVVAQLDGLLPGSLTYEQVQGPLKGPISFDQLRYQDGELDITFERLEVNWSLTRLLTGTLQIQVLTARGIEVHLPEAAAEEETEEDPTPFTLEDITLPINLDLQDINLTDIRVYPAEADQPIVIDAVQLRAWNKGNTLIVDTLQVQAPDGELGLNGRIRPTGTYPVTLNLDWNYRDPEFGTVTGQGRLTGRVQEELTLTHSVSGAVVAELDAQTRDILGDPAWSVHLDLSTLDLGMVSPEMRGSNLAGQLQTEGTLNDYQGSGEFSTTLPELGRTVARLKAAGGTETIQITELILSAADHPLSLTAEADVDLHKQIIDASGQWQALAWPLVGPPQIESPQGTFTVQGTFQDYQGQLEAALAGPEIGRLHAQIQATGSDQVIQITELALRAPDNDLAFDAQGELSFAELAFTANGQWQALAWPLVGPPQIESPQGTFTAQGTPEDYQGQLEAALLGPEIGRLHAQLQATGSDQVIQLTEASLSAPDGDLAFDAQGELSFTELAFTANGQWQALAWPLVGPPQIESPQGTFTAQGTPEDYQGQLEAALLGPDAEALQALIAITGTDKQVQIPEISLRAPDGDLALNAQGELSFAELAFSATGQWQALAWPLSGPPQVESPQGAFQAGGSLQAYQFTLNTEIQGPDIPQGQWRLAGQGSDQALESVTLKGRLLEGEIQGQASARWQPQLSWQAKLTGSRLNPGAHWEDLEGRLRFAARSTGELAEEQLQATFNLEELTGTLQGQDVQGRAQVAVNGEDLTITALRLRAGDARLNVAGTLTERWAIDWQLQVPALGQLLPAAGAVNSSGSLRGPRDLPQADLRLTVAELAYGDTQIERLQGEASVDLSGQSRSRLNITGTDLLLAGQSWQRLVIAGGGTPAEHALTTELTGAAGRLALALNGGLDNGVWQGRLSQLSAQDTLAGDWRLESPMPLQASAQQAQAEQGCLVSEPSRLCLEGQWATETGAQAQVILEQLTFARFEALLPPDAAIDTRLNGQATAVSRPDGTYQAEASLNLTPGRLRMTANGSPVEIPLQEGSLRAEVDQQTASGQLQVNLGDIGQVAAAMQVENLTEQPRVAGTVNANIDDLSLVSAFAPQLQETSGQITADLDLSGTLPVPTIGGELRLRDASTEVPEASIRIEDVQLTAASDGQGPLQITGSARSGPGLLRLAGQVDPATGEVNLDLEGEDFQAANTPDIQALISPNLNISVAENQLRVGGGVRIPQAQLSPPDLPDGGVAVSRDVVIINDPDRPPEEPEQTIGAEPALNVFVNVRIILGDVSVQAFGFQGNVDGNLLVEQTPELPARGTGTIEVETGEYEIYGQELEIERGRLLFGGGPVDNPGLDLRVVRTVGEVTVGAQVRGTLQNPELQLFSDPAMPDTSILSYLLFGRPPDARSGSESELLLKAATALGVRGGNVITRPLEEAFDLDYLGFETGDELGETALVIGKYLSPNLYISYGIGLFEAVNTFNLRYQINEWLSFESTTGGEHSGADLLYTIER